MANRTWTPCGEFDFDLIDMAASRDPHIVEQFIRYVKQRHTNGKVDRMALVTLVRHRAQYYRTLANATAHKDLGAKYKSLYHDIESLAGWFTWIKLV